jgi:hypothetical protein
MPTVSAIANGQNVTINFHLVQTKFNNKSGLLKQTAKDGAMYAGQQAATTAIGNTALGSVPGMAVAIGVGSMLLHKKVNAVNGYSLTFLSPLNADIAVPGSATFQVPAIHAVGSKILLVKTTPSADRDARLISEEHVKMGKKGSLEVLETKRDEVPAVVGKLANGDTGVVPTGTLERGEYVLLMIDSTNSVQLCFDFRVD